MQKFRKYLNITKIDEEQKMVFGWASTEDLDSDGEVIKASALEKALPAYMKFPTIREMHQPIAVGKTQEANIKKGKGLWIGAKIVAKDAWEKVKEGVYPAFSIGGNVVKKVGNVIHELELVEISLVDVPANKAAVIEVWKRGKVTKDAETAYSIANLMIQIKDTIYYYETLKKPTKKLTKVLELLKEVLAVEASETEAEGQKNREQIMEDQGFFFGETNLSFEKQISVLEKMHFDNPMENLIREGVIEIMKAKKIEKDQTVEEDVVEATDETVDELTTEEAEVTDEETESEETTDEVETEDEKETGETADLSLIKSISEIEKAGKVAEKLVEKTNKVETTDVTKAINSIAKTLGTFGEAIDSLKTRVETLEKTPAATKSVAVVAKKTILSNDSVEETKKSDNPLVAEKQARLNEIAKKFNELGAHEFAKQGYSKEAVMLQDEIKQLTESKVSA